MSHRHRLLAGVPAVQANSQSHVACVRSALVFAHSAVTQCGEVHRAEGIAELAQVLDLAHINVGVSLVLGFGVGGGFAADSEAAASGCIEVVFGHGGSSKGTLDKSRGAASGVVSGW
ncbi:hypothetical protein D3C77_493820 [compost metagenome]